MEQKLKDRNHAVFFIDPIEINLPLLDRMYKEMTNPSEKLIELHEKIKAAEGYMPLFIYKYPAIKYTKAESYV
jgi:hypothetical protein